MVPCSRSRMTAAPERISDSMVMLPTICITAMNQLGLQVGIEFRAHRTSDRQRRSALAAAGEVGELALQNAGDVARAVSGQRHGRGVDVDLQRRAPAGDDVGLKFGGITTTKAYRPASMARIDVC